MSGLQGSEFEKYLFAEFKSFLHSKKKMSIFLTMSDEENLRMGAF